MKYVLMGIGNELNGDDGVGNTLAREFVERGWLAIPCETVPENFVSVIEREKPEVLVMVDAAEMDIEPGDLESYAKKGSIPKASGPMECRFRIW